MSLSNNHKSNGQEDACITFIKQTLKKCCDTNKGINLPLLHIRPTLNGPGLQGKATILFNRPIQSLFSKIKIAPMLCNFYDKYGIIKQRQQCADKVKDTCKDFTINFTQSTVVL